jgi:hypothetical protein
MEGNDDILNNKRLTLGGKCVVIHISASLSLSFSHTVSIIRS